MNPLAKVVAAVVAIPTAFVKEVIQGVGEIEAAKLNRANAPKVEDLSEEELQDILRRRAKASK